MAATGREKATAPSWLADHFPIIRLNSGALLATEESQQYDWIPLIDPIHLDSQANCPRRPITQPGGISTGPTSSMILGEPAGAPPITHWPPASETSR